MAGLTTTGVTVKDVDEVISDIEADELANVDSALNVNADSVIGQLNGIFAAAVAELWDFFQELYWSAYPDTATGQSLSYVAAMTGAIRRPATYAELAVALTGTANQTVPAGIRAYAFENPDSEFILDNDVLLSALGAGTGTMTASGTGPSFTAADGEEMTIITPHQYLTSITTASADALTPGTDEETDARLRERREQMLALPGASTVESIRSDVLQVRGVDACTVFENPTSVQDVNGMPPYSIEVLVYSSAAPNYDPDELAAQIWASKPAGTQTYGTEGPVSTLDSTNIPHDIYYSEPTTANLWITAALKTTNDGTYIGDDGVKAALEQWGLGLAVGESVYASDLIRVVAGLAGVDYVAVPIYVERDDGTPDTTEWLATARELGLIDAARILVVQIP